MWKLISSISFWGYGKLRILHIYLVAIQSLKIYTSLSCKVVFQSSLVEKSCSKVFCSLPWICEHWCLYSFFFIRLCMCLFSYHDSPSVRDFLQIISYWTRKVREGWLEEYFKKCSCDKNTNSSGKPCTKILPSSELDEEREKEIKHTWYHNQCRYPTNPSTK